MHRMATNLIPTWGLAGRALGQEAREMSDFTVPHHLG